MPIIATIALALLILGCYFISWLFGALVWVLSNPVVVLKTLGTVALIVALICIIFSLPSWVRMVLEAARGMRQRDEERYRWQKEEEAKVVAAKAAAVLPSPAVPVLPAVPQQRVQYPLKHAWARAPFNVYPTGPVLVPDANIVLLEEYEG
jgi:Zn-dependent protease with chaperone function